MVVADGTLGVTFSAGRHEPFELGQLRCYLPID